MNPRLPGLHPYPFERLNALRATVTPNPEFEHVPLSIGEPKHAPPDPVIAALADPERLSADLAAYPATRGGEALREAIAAWLERRFGATVNADTQVLPVAGTREALFSFGQAVCGSKTAGVVLMPNPFYQIYEGACLLAGAQPWYVNATPEDGYRGNFAAVPEDVWQRTELVYLCSPGNPAGAVMDDAGQRWLIEQADRYDFVIAADECYSEIYDTAPPTGMLETCARMGRDDYRRVVVFHSLSKRSSLPGLRSGFVAGDATILEDYYLYRTYEGCAMPAHTQHASALAWDDEDYVTANRQAYRNKFAATLPILDDVLDVYQPEGGFYLWARTPVDDQTFTAELFRDCHISVLPGSFLGREWAGENPGSGHVRMALVAPTEACVSAATRMADWMRRRF